MSGLTKNIPSELRLSQKWDYAIETALVRGFGGLFVAGIASIVIFRQKSPRIAFSAFGAGLGLGDAYRLSTIAFEQEKSTGGN